MEFVYFTGAVFGGFCCCCYVIIPGCLELCKRCTIWYNKKEIVDLENQLDNLEELSRVSSFSDDDREVVIEGQRSHIVKLRDKIENISSYELGYDHDKACDQISKKVDNYSNIVEDLISSALSKQRSKAVLFALNTKYPLANKRFKHFIAHEIVDFLPEKNFHPIPKLPS